MARYINYDELLDKWHDLGFDEISKIYKINALNHFIKNLPTADVVEVVRCKDCQYRYTISCNAKHERSDMDYCSHGLPKGIYDHFCSYGERRDA